MKKRISTFYIADKPFRTTKTSVSKTHKIGIFSKGVSPWFWSKIWNFLNVSFLCKMHPEKVFGDVLVRKKAFLDNRNMELKRRQNWHFCKGDKYYMILVKKLKFFHLLCLFKIDRGKLFADVLDKKIAFKDYKNNCLRKTQN